VKTPEPTIHVGDLLPEISTLAKPAYRLHHLGDGSADRTISRFGGPILWPSTLDWPICSEHAQVYTPVLQLFQSDVPEVSFYPGTDLLQLLWCACEHGVQMIDAKPFEQVSGWTKPTLVWLDSNTLSQPLAEIPMPSDFEESYSPLPGVIAVEHIVEYPGLRDLPPALCSQLNGISLPENTSMQLSRFAQLYEDQFSACPGVKIGGYVSWIQAKAIPLCECDVETEFLLTVATTEFDPRSEARWRAPGVSEAGHGLQLGDCGCIHIFICRRCPDWPIKWVVECS